MKPKLKEFILNGDVLGLAIATIIAFLMLYKGIFVGFIELIKCPTRFGAGEAFGYSFGFIVLGFLAIFCPVMIYLNYKKWK